MSTLIVAAALTMFTAAAQQPEIKVSLNDAYRHCSYIANGDTLPYRELAPAVKTGGKYPLVVFMHGAGERGNDNELQLTHGAQMFVNPVNQLQHPAYVIFPQCPESGYWAYEPKHRKPGYNYPDSMPILKEPTKWIKMVHSLVEKYLAEGNIDPDRVYIIGLSMGGMAVYDMAERYPDIWAAAVPICGSINPTRLNKARRVKFRIFHGDADQSVPVEGSRKAYLKLKSLGADVEYIEFPGCTHGSWNPAFCRPDFMDWLFAQRRK